MSTLPPAASCRNPDPYCGPAEIYDGQPGASLEWNPYGHRPWLVHSFHRTLGQARDAAHKTIGRYGNDGDLAHWRIVAEKPDG